MKVQIQLGKTQYLLEPWKMVTLAAAAGAGTVAAITGILTWILLRSTH